MVGVVANHYYLGGSEGGHEEAIGETERRLIILYLMVKQYRYLAPRSLRPRPFNKFQLDLSTENIGNAHQPWLNDAEFLSAYRMQRSALESLVSKIAAHPVFNKNGTRRGKKQNPVIYQVMTLLFYLGSSGSGASQNRTRDRLHIGKGTRDVYIWRCVTAIRDILRPQYYQWPSEGEREKIASEIKEEFQLPNCLGFADGTLVYCTYQPQREDAPDFSGRKDGYSLTVLIVGDHERKVRYYLAGFVGSAHDQRVHRNSKIHRNWKKYFGDKYYIVTDSAFEATSATVPTYKVPIGGSLSEDKSSFNTVLGRLPVISEHINGILKGRFPILTSMPMKITEDRRSFQRVVEIIDVCIILHNFLIEENLTQDVPFFIQDRSERTIRDTKDG
jgi:hypothetical protein